MAVLLFLLTIVLVSLLIIGLISPKTVLKFTKKPSRGKATLIYGGATVILLFGYGILHESSWELALQNPAETTELSLKYKKLKELPEELRTMPNLVELDLSNNELRSLPEYLKEFRNLKVLDLAKNPIKKLPDWISEMPSLIELNLDETQIDLIPDGLESIQVTYRDTPLDSIENYVAPEPIADDTDESIDERTESFGEYAIRQFLGKDYGARRKFKKGEIYYNDPVTKDQVDIIGEFMLLMGFFNDEREASMLLDQNDDDIYELKIVVVGEDALTDEVIDGFGSIEKVIQEDVFPEDQFHLVLTDQEFKAIHRIK